VLAAAFICVSRAGAQTPADSATRLTPIVVTATGTPVSSASLGSPVTVLDGAALRRAGVTTVADALRGVASLSLAQAGSYGAQTSLFLRGGESDFVSVMVDGVALNQAGGFADLADLSTANVDRIEIVRGPSSVLYGSDAMTGVVQIFTRHGRGPAHVTAEARAGGSGSTVAAATAGLGGGWGGLSAGVQREATDGVYAFNNRDDAASASARWTLTPDARTNVDVAVRWKRGVFHYPTDGSGMAVDSNQFQIARRTAVSLEAGRRLTPALEVRALLGLVTARDSTDDAPDGPADTTGFYAYESRADTERRMADLRANVRAGRAVLLTAGVTINREQEHSVNSYQSDFGPGGGAVDVRRTNRAAYLQALTGAGRLTAQLGVRLDDNQRFGRFATWRAGGAWRLASGTRLRANVGTAFKEPTFGENFSTGYSVGNPDLRPERSRSIEAGLEQQLARGRVVATATVFAQRFRDLIQYTFATPNPGDPNYYNVASATSSGLELEVRAAPGRALSLTADYTWLRTAARDSGFDGAVFAPGQPLLKRPAHRADLSGEWRGFRRAVLGARVVFVGARDDLDFSAFPAARVRLPAYGRLDLWGTVEVARLDDGRGTVALTLRGENVTGSRFEEVYGFRTPGARLLVGARVGGQVR